MRNNILLFTLIVVGAQFSAAQPIALHTPPMPANPIAPSPKSYSTNVTKIGSKHRSAVRHSESDIIDYRPEGTSKYYQRSGFSIVGISGGKVETREQSGFAEVIYAPDGKTVYLFNPVAVQGYDTWVKGTINGNTITVPLGQPLNYAGLWDTCISIGLVTTGTSHTSFKSYATSGQVTYTIDGNKIRLNGTNSSLALGTFFEDDDLATPNCDYNTVYTEAVLPSVVTPPDGSNSTIYHHNGTAYYDGDYHTLKNVDVKVVRDGVNFYFQGLLSPDGTSYLPDAWVKGILANGLVFISTQFAGMERVYPMYLMGADIDGQNLTPSSLIYEYDEENDEFKALNCYALNYDSQDISYGGLFLPGNTLSRDSVVFDPVTPPDEATIDEGYTFEGKKRNVENENVTWEDATFNGINVAFVDNDLYIQGLNVNLPKAWVKGSKTVDDDGSVNYLFKRPQFMGIMDSDYGEVNQYMLSADDNYNIQDVVLRYDNTASRSQFVLLNDLIINEVPSMIYYWNWYQLGAIIYKEKPAILLTGDLNGDGKIDVSDVNLLINIVLKYDVNLAESAIVDLTGDGKVDVADVNELINIILAKKSN